MPSKLKLTKSNCNYFLEKFKNAIVIHCMTNNIEFEDGGIVSENKNRGEFLVLHKGEQVICKQSTNGIKILTEEELEKETDKYQWLTF